MGIWKIPKVETRRCPVRKTPWAICHETSIIKRSRPNQNNWDQVEGQYSAPNTQPKLLTQAGLWRWNSERREYVDLVETDETGVQTVEEATTNVSAREENPHPRPPRQTRLPDKREAGDQNQGVAGNTRFHLASSHTPHENNKKKLHPSWKAPNKTTTPLNVKGPNFNWTDSITQSGIGISDATYQLRERAKVLITIARSRKDNLHKRQAFK